VAGSDRWIGGKYELIARAGQGGMANVWRGVLHGAAGFSKPVAIKRVHGGLSQDPTYAAMFVEEARVVSSLQHPNIVQVHDFDHDTSGNFFLVLEWIEGLDMDAWVRAHAIANLRAPWHLVAAIVIEVLRGLTAAHEHRNDKGALAPIVHRDVNPSNILLGNNGIVKLTDFGLARAQDRRAGAAITGPGIVKGKLSYLAPEIFDLNPASTRSDLYSLGIVLWEALSNERLFAADTPAETVRKARAGEVPHLGRLRTDLPPSLIETAHTALARHPEERFDSADEMRRALTAILRVHPEPTDAKPIAWSVNQAMARLRAA
jgi:serine/threonine-protein kinase